MSTKIYTAYRTKSGVNHYQLIHDLRVQGQTEVKKALRAFYLQLMYAVKEDSEEYKKQLFSTKSDRLARLSIASDTIRTEYREQLKSFERNPFHLDVSIAFHPYKGRLYILPYCDWTMKNVLDFLKKEKRLEDFAYWNNTDKPKKITQKDWDYRKSVWDTIDKNWADCLALDLCTYRAFYLIDPELELASEFRKLDKP